MINKLFRAALIVFGIYYTTYLYVITYDDIKSDYELFGSLFFSVFCVSFVLVFIESFFYKALQRFSAFSIGVGVTFLSSLLAMIISANFYNATIKLRVVNESNIPKSVTIDGKTYHYDAYEGDTFYFHKDRVEIDNKTYRKGYYIVNLAYKIKDIAYGPVFIYHSIDSYEVTNTNIFQGKVLLLSGDADGVYITTGGMIEAKESELKNRRYFKVEFVSKKPNILPRKHSKQHETHNQEKFSTFLDDIERGVTYKTALRRKNVENLRYNILDVRYDEDDENLLLLRENNTIEIYHLSKKKDKLKLFFYKTLQVKKASECHNLQLDAKCNVISLECKEYIHLYNYKTEFYKNLYVNDHVSDTLLFDKNFFIVYKDGTLERYGAPDYLFSEALDTDKSFFGNKVPKFSTNYHAIDVVYEDVAEEFVVKYDNGKYWLKFTKLREFQPKKEQKLQIKFKKKSYVVEVVKNKVIISQ